jgi:hypothetical protein
MRRFLGGIDATDEEHGAAWLSTESGFSLEWNGDGRLVFTAGEGAPPRHLRGVTRERALELWLALAAGNLMDVESCAWQRGIGYVRSPEREAEVREWQRGQDREFYDSLGAERAELPCRRDGCARGAVSFSVLCRPNHFESIKKRPSPFDD